MTRLADEVPDVAVPAQAAAGDKLRRALEEAVLLAEADAERLADELHNGLMQSLVVARHAVARDAAAGAGDLPGADDAVRSCLAETRRTVWHLRPRAAGLGALPDAVDELVARVRADHGLEVTAEVGVRRAVSVARAAVAYRLAQAVARAVAAHGGERLRLEVAEDAFGAIVVRHDASAAIHDALVESAWAKRGDALRVRPERRA